MRRVAYLLTAVLLAFGLVSIVTPAGAVPSGVTTTAGSAPPANPAGCFHPTRSIRVFTTGSQPLAAGVVRKVAIAGHANLPSNIGAVEVNVTVLGPTKSGSLAVYPGTSAFTGYSTVSFTAGQTQQSMITANLGSDGTLALRSNTAEAKLSVILDVVGYYVAGNATEDGTYHAIPTVRVSNPGQTGAIAPGATLTVSTGGKGAIPALVGSIVVDLTVQSPSRAGSVDIYDGPSRLSTFTFAAGTTVQRMATIRLDDGADFQLKNAGTTSVVVIVDAVGYFTDWRTLGSGAYLGGSDGTSPATPSIAPLDEARFQAVQPDTSGMWAVRMQVQLLRPTKAGSLSIYSTAETYTGVASVSFQAGSVGVYELTSLVSPGGLVTIRNNSSAPIKLTASVVGEFSYQTNPLSFSGQAADFTSADSGNTTGLACPTATFCVAVSSNGDAAVMTGATWSPASAVMSGGGLSDVSCVSDQFCVAIGGAGVALYQQGAWSVPAPIDSGQTLTALSCSSSGLCVVGDSSGRVLMYRAGSWSQPTVLGSAAVTALSCAPDGSCMSVLENGVTTQFRGGAWRAVRISGFEHLALSCASASYCMAVSTVSVAAIWNGSTWVDAPGRYEDVDCPSASFCEGISDAGGLIAWDGHYRSVDLFPVVYLNDLVRISCPSTQTCFISNGGRAVGTFSRPA